MISITKFIEGKLKLKVNKEKSTVGRPWKLKFLGYTFYLVKGGVRFRVHAKSILKLKKSLKELTGRSKVKKIESTYTKLKQKIVGWINYFRMADMKGLLKQLDEWLRRRIRMCYWKQWKKIRTKYKNLMKLGATKQKAWEHANTRKSYWRTAMSPILQTTITNKRLEKAGLISLLEQYMKVS
jgi:hypothetical protein